MPPIHLTASFNWQACVTLAVPHQRQPLAQVVHMREHSGPDEIPVTSHFVCLAVKVLMGTHQTRFGSAHISLLTRNSVKVLRKDMKNFFNIFVIF